MSKIEIRSVGSAQDAATLTPDEQQLIRAFRSGNDFVKRYLLKHAVSVSAMYTRQGTAPALTLIAGGAA